MGDGGWDVYWLVGWIIGWKGGAVGGWRLWVWVWVGWQFDRSRMYMTSNGIGDVEIGLPVFV